MRLRTTLAIAAACAATAFAFGCGGDDDDTGSAAATTTTAADASKQRNAKKPAERPSGALVEVGDSQFGDILTDADGRTLYLFDKETTDRSECFGACEDAWPVLFTDGEPEAGKGIDQSLLGTTDHGGKTQVTYNGHPLYYYVDEGPNEVLCQGVYEYGGTWLVVDPSSGDAIQ